MHRNVISIACNDVHDVLSEFNRMVLENCVNECSFFREDYDGKKIARSLIFGSDQQPCEMDITLFDTRNMSFASTNAFKNTYPYMYNYGNTNKDHFVEMFRAEAEKADFLHAVHYFCRNNDGLAIALRELLSEFGSNITHYCTELNRPAILHDNFDKVLFRAASTRMFNGTMFYDYDTCVDYAEANGMGSHASVIGHHAWGYHARRVDFLEKCVMLDPFGKFKGNLRKDEEFVPSLRHHQPFFTQSYETDFGLSGLNFYPGRNLHMSVFNSHSYIRDSEVIHRSLDAFNRSRRTFPYIGKSMFAINSERIRRPPPRQMIYGARSSTNFVYHLDEICTGYSILRATKAYEDPIYMYDTVLLEESHQTVLKLRERYMQVQSAFAAQDASAQ